MVVALVVVPFVTMTVTEFVEVPVMLFMAMSCMIVPVMVIMNLRLLTFNLRLMNMVIVSVARLAWSMRPRHRTSKNKT
jgi:hypothetical protein